MDHEQFSRLTSWTIHATGQPKAFLAALTLVIAWAVMGPYFHWSDTWQLIANTATTIITFLMVFLLQAAQNRDSKEIHLKLNELILSMEKARNDFMRTENMTESQLNEAAKTQSERNLNG